MFGRFFDGAMVQGDATTEALLELLAQVAGREAAGWFREQLATPPAFGP
jgi:hypothetical protein